MSVNFDLYRTFYYVGKYRSITAASKALFVTQPTVTHAIQILERDLECSLFIRSQKGVSFTPEGERLHKAVASACETIFEAEATLEASKNLSEGFITIGASETTLHHYLIPLLSSFKQAYPGIHLRLSNSNTPDMLDEILKENMDFAVLVIDPGYKHKDLSITRLMDFADVIIAGNEFSNLRNRRISLKDVSAYPLVTLEKGTFTRHFFDHVFDEQGLLLTPDIELATSDLIVPIVENGLGLGLVPEPFIRESLSQNKIFRLDIKEQIPPRKICLVQKKKASPSIAGEAFIRHLLSNSR